MDTTQTGAGITFHPDPNYEYKVKSSIKFKDNYSPFSMVGQLRHQNTRKNYMDIFDKLNTVSKSALNVFNQIKLNLNAQIGIATMPEWADYNPTQRRELNRRLTELREADIVIKLRPIPELLKPAKFSYMVNPYLMIPWKYTEAKKLWKAVKATYKPVKD
jgi:hypothetical protein